MSLENTRETVSVDFLEITDTTGVLILLINAFQRKQHRPHALMKTSVQTAHSTGFLWMGFLVLANGTSCWRLNKTMGLSGEELTGEWRRGRNECVSENEVNECAEAKSD